MRLKKPYVVAVRNTDVNVFFKNLFYLRHIGIKIIENAEAVFFLSDSYKRTVFEKYIPSFETEAIEKKVYVIPNGIDSFWLDNIYQDRDYVSTYKRLSVKQLRLVFVGLLSQEKNITATLKAIKELECQGWQIEFTVIGNVKDKKQYKAVIEDNHTNYVGPKNKEDIIQFLRESDIFVMPSKTETFGLVYAEALSQGMPVIYTRGQGFDGQFEEGEVGYSVNCYDADEIAQRIIDITTDYERIS